MERTVMTVYNAGETDPKQPGVWSVQSVLAAPSQ